MPQLRHIRDSVASERFEPGPSIMLPLYLTHSSVALIDDDAPFIDTMKMVLQVAAKATFHTEPNTFEQVLADAAGKLRQEQQAFFACVEAQNEADGNALPLLLRFLATPLRFELAGVAVSDYMMPVIDGVSLLSRHGELGLQRVLLTGVADSRLAIQAFNAGNIEAYIAKQSRTLFREFTATLREQLARSAQARGQILARAINQKTTGCLRTPAVMDKLTTLLAQIGADEYVVLGRPAGLLVLTKDHRVQWVQLDDETSLREQVFSLADIATEVCDFDVGEATRRIAECRASADLQLHLELPWARPNLQPAHVLSKSPFLCASVFQLPQLPPDLMPRFHDEWLLLQPGGS